MIRRIAWIPAILLIVWMYAGLRDTGSSDSVRGHGRIHKRSVAAVSCPRDTYPLIVRGEARECHPGNSTASCPEGFICYFDGLDRRYICCGKATGYCDGGRPYVDAETGRPVACGSAGGARCKLPYECSDTGYCCLDMNQMEPPPVGCPWGTRPLKDHNKQLLPCTPGMSKACPGGAICYYDSLEGTNRCCGRDPGEGCPSGTRAIKVNSRMVPCLPGDPQQACPGKTVCQWSYLIDRFQCCEADDGCPFDASPFYESNGGAIRSCRGTDQQSSSLTTDAAVSRECPTDYTCQFNFWTVSYQCCGKKAGMCPRGQVTYLEPNTNSARTCPMGGGLGATCPAGYSCQASTNGQGLCCGPPGQCPRGTSPFTDTSGRAYSCSPRVPDSCLRPAACSQASGGPPGQYLCCVGGIGLAAGQCPLGYTAVNDRPCSPSSPTACPAGAACLQSPAQPTLFLCCQFGGAETPAEPRYCPVGHRPHGPMPLACDPVAAGCPSPAQCLPSPGVPGLSYCCSSHATQTGAHCPSGFAVAQDGPVACDPMTLGPCRRGTFCLASGLGGGHVCCQGAPGSPPLRCPAPYSPQEGHIQCSTQNPSCAPGALCLPTSQQPSLSLCCTPAAPAAGQCPSGYNLQNGVVTQCSRSFPTCLSGSECRSSPVNPTFLLCCTPTTDSSSASPQCPPAFSMPAPDPQPCTPGPDSTTCPAGSQCLQARDHPGVHICCQPAGLSGQFLCPGLGQPSMIGSSYTFCSRGATPSTCPRAYSCQPTINAPGVAICCAPGPLAPTCPGGVVPLQLPSMPDHYAFCTLTSPQCPDDAACQTATNMVNTHVCCLEGRAAAGPSAAQCPLAGSTPLQVSGVVQTCAGPSARCPRAGYECQRSTTNGQYVCCSDAPPGGVQCANGQPIYQPGAVTFFCNPALGQCPANHDCVPSTLSPHHVCCIRGGEQSWTCVSGRQPFPNALNPQTCLPADPSCPAGTQCELSSVSGTFVCCAALGPSTSQQARCPASATPYLEGLAPRRCTGPSDLSCPAPYSCAPSDQANLYICCRFISNGAGAVGTSGLRCYSGAPAFALPGAIEPQRCSVAAQNCPAGYSCQASSLPGVTVCCGSVSPQSSMVCPDGTPALIQGTQPILCHMPGIQCPAGFVCTPSTGGADARICCNPAGAGAPPLPSPHFPAADGQVCGPGQEPFYVNGQPQTCRVGGASARPCLDGYICQQGPGGLFFCCQGPRCPSGVTLLETNGHPRFCNPASSNSCPLGTACQQSSNQAGNYVCCVIGPGQQTPALTRCIGRSTYMLPTNRPQMCTAQGPNVCPAGTECSSFTTTNEMVCCSSAEAESAASGSSANHLGITTTSPVCPSGDPYRDPSTRQYHYCSDTNYACPEGFLCKQSAHDSTQYVCCSGRGTCQKGWSPYLDSRGAPQQCSPFDKDACKWPGGGGLPFKCQQSTKPGEYLCCTESSTGHLNTNRRSRPIDGSIGMSRRRTFFG